MSAFFVKVTTRHDVNIDQAVAEAQRRLGTDLIRHAHETANRHGADPLFVEAVMIAESFQRPKWFRVLERRFGRYLGAKSYGVMQVPNSQPISDEESVIEAVRLFFQGIQFTRDQYGDPVITEVHQAAFNYNRSTQYPNLVVKIYLSLLQPSQ